LAIWPRVLVRSDGLRCANGYDAQRGSSGATDGGFIAGRRPSGAAGWAWRTDMQKLNHLINAAMQLAGTDDLISHNARLWQSEGGRACPLGWDACFYAI